MMGTVLKNVRAIMSSTLEMIFAFIKLWKAVRI